MCDLICGCGVCVFGVKKVDRRGVVGHSPLSGTRRTDGPERACFEPRIMIGAGIRARSRRVSFSFSSARTLPFRRVDRDINRNSRKRPERFGTMD